MLSLKESDIYRPLLIDVSKLTRIHYNFSSKLSIERFNERFSDKFIIGGIRRCGVVSLYDNCFKLLAYSSIGVIGMTLCFRKNISGNCSYKDIGGVGSVLRSMTKEYYGYHGECELCLIDSNEYKYRLKQMNIQYMKYRLQCYDKNLSLIKGSKFLGNYESLDDSIILLSNIRNGMIFQFNPFEYHVAVSKFCGIVNYKELFYIDEKMGIIHVNEFDGINQMRTKYNHIDTEFYKSLGVRICSREKLIEACFSDRCKEKIINDFYENNKKIDEL